MLYSTETYSTFIKAWLRFAQAYLEMLESVLPYSISHTTSGRPDLKLVHLDADSTPETTTQPK